MSFVFMCGHSIANCQRERPRLKHSFIKICARIRRYRYPNRILITWRADLYLLSSPPPLSWYFFLRNSMSFFQAAGVLLQDGNKKWLFSVHSMSNHFLIYWHQLSRPDVLIEIRNAVAIFVTHSIVSLRAKPSIHLQLTRCNRWDGK